MSEPGDTGVRLADIDDLAALAPLLLDFIYWQNGEYADGEGVYEQLASVLRNESESRILVYQEQGALIGFLQGPLSNYFGRPGYAGVSRLWVVPRARRSGVGRALFEEQMRRARLAGASTLAWHGAEGAENFYRFFGAHEVVGEDIHSPLTWYELALSKSKRQ